MREACYVPAQLKRKSSTLMKFLDQEGGRLSTERHLRSLQLTAKLYQGVAAHAPALLPLVSRAQACMEEQFERYRLLEEGRARLLRRLHAGVMRDVLAKDKEAA